MVQAKLVADLRPKVVDIKAYYDDDYLVEFVFVQEDGSPIDVSDRSWAMQWRPNPYSDDFETFEIDETNAATGIVVATILRTKTADFVPNGAWDLQSTKDDKNETIYRGCFELTKDVTRSSEPDDEDSEDDEP